MQFLTDFADQAVTLPVAVATLLTFVLVRWWRGALAWAGVLAVTLGLVLVFKLLLFACGATPSPYLPRSPSGHVASATVVYGGLAAIILAGRRAALMPAVAIAAVVAATRLGLRVHTYADVIGGGVIGFAGVLALVRFAGPLPRFPRWLPALLALAAVALLHGDHLDAEQRIRALAAYFHPPFAACRGLPRRAQNAVFLGLRSAKIVLAQAPQETIPLRVRWQSRTRTALSDKMEQLTPLQVLLALMQRKWDAGEEKEAAALARAAAPYVHCRATPKPNNPDLSQLTDAELESYGEGRGMEAEADDQE